MSAVHTAVPNLVQIRPRGASGQMGENNEFLFIYLFIYTFFMNSPTGQTRRRIFTLDGSHDADSRKKGVPLGGFVDILLPILGLNPPNPSLGRE